MIKKFVAKNWYLLGMLAAIVLAVCYPALGRALNPNKISSTAGIIVIFFLTGFSLQGEQILKGVRDVKLHIYLQVFIFVISPLYFFLTAQVLRQVCDPTLMVGVYALGVLPTTISSCIVFTQLMHGNVMGAVFNATLSNLLGIFVSPLLLTLFLHETGAAAMPLSDVLAILRALSMYILLPFVAGHGLHYMAREFSHRHKKRFSTINSILILVIIYFAFAKSLAKVFGTMDPRDLAVLLTFLAVSQPILSAMAYGGARLLGLNRESCITVLFTGSQKTLAMGVPLLSAYFAKTPELVGIAIMPILFYHPWQLFVAGVIKNFSRGWKDIAVEAGSEA